MRLTLRTLLAWLDDTLEPSQVREIGKQVSQSPFAQELADRIHRVTRQRRLAVPSRSGPEGTDPNLVAGYLDNDLDPEAVAEFEKRCLTSDVNLAEVASVHQILSLLGQKVKVPSEARARMYQLVKGRETISTRSKGSSTRRRPPAPEPVTTPLQTWVVPEPAQRHWLERFGPVFACLLLIGLASWSAWRSLAVPSYQRTPVPSEPPVAANAEALSPAPAEAGPSAPVADQAEDVAAKAAAESTASPAPDSDPSSPSKVANASPAVPKRQDGAIEPSAPSGSAGLAEKAEGVLLRDNVEKREWERLTDATPLNRPDRLLCLAPFRAPILLGKTRMVLVGETEVRILSTSSDSEATLELVHGRLLIRPTVPGTLQVVFSGRTASLDLTTEQTLALERVETWSSGRPSNQAPPLSIACVQGDLSFTIDQQQSSLKASSLALVDSAGQVKRSSPEALPAWATPSDPSPYELQVRDQFLSMFHPGRPVLLDIVVATEDERPEIKQLAISALQALGDLSYLMPLLKKEGDPAARRSAIAAIRSYLGRGPDAIARAREQLDAEFGDNLGSLTQQMLLGYTPAEASNRETYSRLVNLLAPDQESVGIRELALDSLKRLTGRDDLGYDPDHPAGKGLEAWNELLRRNELRPLAPRTRAR